VRISRKFFFKPAQRAWTSSSFRGCSHHGQQLEPGTPPAIAIERIRQKSQGVASAAVHPRLAAMILEAAKTGAGDLACELAVRLSEPRLRLNAQNSREATSDLDRILEDELTFNARKLRAHLRRWMPRLISFKATVNVDQALDRAILFAFSDQVGWRRGQTAGTERQSA